MSASVLGSYSIAVLWSRPISAHGDIAEYRIYYSISSNRKTADDEVVAAVSGLETTVYLKNLSPFTSYVVQVIAVIISRINSKFFEGRRSSEVSVQTAEAGRHFVYMYM